MLKGPGGLFVFCIFVFLYFYHTELCILYFYCILIALVYLRVEGAWRPFCISRGDTFGNYTTRRLQNDPDGNIDSARCAYKSPLLPGNCERRRNMESKWNVRAVIGVLEVQKILVCAVRSYFAFSERERGSLKLREDFMRLCQKRPQWHNGA